MNIEIIVTSDGSHSLINKELNETYHSTHGAIQESLHVFIKNGLQFWLEQNQTKEISILEIGFGTGLNALLTLRGSLNQEARFHYTTIEAFPVAFELVDQLNYAQQLNFEMAEKYFQDIHRSEWNAQISIMPNFILEKHQGKIQAMNFPDQTFDVVFFDAFSPDKQPEMWEMPILEKIAKTMKNNSALVTYCAKGQLKRDLKSLGLKVETLAGPPGKREMVRAVKSN
ncbi:MAG: tRNA (5-methylaminomethyl-2-thiouridine)(34)-methyltransferase MnmD [Bacteroidetes bacterium]|nr:tRNA (5-methylaminomethyl-2-thiouridine)(34)-methyltransferase MnmD [Bacteroidota bacterium]